MDPLWRVMVIATPATLSLRALASPWSRSGLFSAVITSAGPSANYNDEDHSLRCRGLIIYLESAKASIRASVDFTRWNLRSIHILETHASQRSARLCASGSLRIEGPVCNRR